MADILGLRNILEKPSLTLDDLDKLVEETRLALRNANDIYISAEQNRIKAAKNYDRAVALRDKFVKLTERSTK